MNTKNRTVELKVRAVLCCSRVSVACGLTQDHFFRQTTLETPAGYVQKAADFLHAFMLGFAIQDAVALLRLDDLFVGRLTSECAVRAAAVSHA